MRREALIPSVVQMRHLVTITWFAAAACLLAVPAASQQVFESVGERALGMGGAFVAVADDASASHWNPAGLALGQPAGMTIGWHRFQVGNPEAAPGPGFARRSATLTSLGTWPLGVSYGKFRTSSLSSGPEDKVVATTLENSLYAATVLHTVTDGLVVGATLKYLRGGVVEMVADEATAGDALERVAEQDADTQGAFDLDLGVMADFRKVRMGLTWKNLRTPSFADNETSANTLPRQARLGLAILPTDGLTLAMDLDLDTVALPDGPRRMLALGGEGRLARRLAVRSGIRWSLEGDRRRVGAVGGSVMFRAGLWLDGHYSQGPTRDDREFGAALRAGF